MKKMHWFCSSSCPTPMSLPKKKLEYVAETKKLPWVTWAQTQFLSHS